MASIVQPHMFMSPTSTAGRSAGGSPRRRARVWSGEPNSRWVKWVATTVRLVPSTSISACEQHRVDGSNGQLRQRDRPVAADRLAGEEGQAPVAVAARSRSGSARPTSFGLGSSAGPRHRHRDDVASRGPSATSSCWATPPSGAQVSWSTITSASKDAQAADDVERRRSRRARCPRPQCTLKHAMVSSGTASGLPGHRLRCTPAARRATSSTGKSWRSGSGSACSSAQVTA